MIYRSLAAGVLVLAAVPDMVLSQGQATARKPDPAWLNWNADARTVTFQLIAGVRASASPFNFNGYTDGKLTLVVPAGATVVMPFVNEDGVPHSAEAIMGTGPIPNMGGDPAIQRAYTIKLLEGLNQGEKDVMRFTAAPAATYRIMCGVPGHGVSGMYIAMRVDANAKEPLMESTPGAKN
jgi:sulfocyanin